MDVKRKLKEMQRIYKNGENIIAHGKGADGMVQSEYIEASYDLQAGSYIEGLNDPVLAEHHKNYVQALAKVIDTLSQSEESQAILEAGIGDGITLANLIGHLKQKPSQIYGFDLSWSRVRFAHNYMRKYNLDPAGVVMGDLFHIPFADEAVDIVYTSHSMEPNGGREREALIELYRVTKRYLILLEPAHDFASPEGKERMEKHGYVKNILEIAQRLGYKIIEHRLFDYSSNPLNPTGLTIIEKESSKNEVQNTLFSCPLTGESLDFMRGSYFSKEGLLAYPVIDGVACLVSSCAIIATHFDEF